MSDDGNNVTVASNVLGTIGTVFWCVQLIPQIWYNWRRKSTEGLPPLMMFLWAACAVPMGAYLILQRVNLPLQIQPQIFGVFALITWGQTLYYGKEYHLFKAILLVVGIAVLFGGLEALLILTLKIPYRNGVTWPDLVVGIVASVLLVGGLIPPYFELWKRDGRVIGFNWFFLSIDTLGGLFSLFALAAQGTFDVLGGVMYIIIITMEVGIYVSHIIWRIRYCKVIKEAKQSGKTVDEILNKSRDGSDTEKGGEQQSREVDAKEVEEEARQANAGD